jgi:hypothetical protein
MQPFLPKKANSTSEGAIVSLVNPETAVHQPSDTGRQDRHRQCCYGSQTPIECRRKLISDVPPARPELIPIVAAILRPAQSTNSVAKTRRLRLAGDLSRNYGPEAAPDLGRQCALQPDRG